VEQEEKRKKIRNPKKTKPSSLTSHPKSTTPKQSKIKQHQKRNLHMKTNKQLIT
jgi:hypothetical protein